MASSPIASPSPWGELWARRMTASSRLLPLLVSLSILPGCSENALAPTLEAPSYAPDHAPALSALTGAPSARKPDSLHDPAAGDLEATAPPAAEARATDGTTLGPARAGQTVRIPAGPLRAGSAPGTAHRRPHLEADLVAVALPAFDIDRLPYPNDPEAAVLKVSSQVEAAQHCAERGRRLCHELEWERACKGDTGHDYPGGGAFDPERCGAGGCASPFGVLSLGTHHGEWTASPAKPHRASGEERAIVRGARAGAAPHRHRCAARHARRRRNGDPAAFRCCGKAAPELVYPPVGMTRVFRDLDLTAPALRNILAAIPELAELAADFAPYGEQEAQRALTRGSGATVHWEVAEGPFAWSPSPGDELFVFAGHGSDSTAIVAIYPLADGSFRHAASFIFENEAVPVALMRTHSSRPRLLWTTAHGRAGEGGVIERGEDARVQVLQQ